MRLFVAVYPSAAAVDSLRAVLPSDPALRWTTAEQWHLTLVFLGEVAEDRVPELAERLARAASRSVPMELAFAGVGTFPKQSRRGRVLWSAVTGDVDDLTLLADRCAAAARRTGLEVEDRKFRAHLTLARARDHEADMTTHVSALGSYAGPTWRADEVVLVRSFLGRPVRHEPVASWELAGHPAVTRHSPRETS